MRQAAGRAIPSLLPFGTHLEEEARALPMVCEAESTHVPALQPGHVVLPACTA